jgi:hypothetical protein
MEQLPQLLAVMQQNKGENDRSAEVSPRLGHRRDFKVAVPQIELDRACSESGEIEAAEVAALVGSKDQPVRRHSLHRHRRSPPRRRLVFELGTEHCDYRASPGVTRIRPVAWIGLNDHHLWNVTRDRWTRLRYRTGHNDSYV